MSLFESHRPGITKLMILVLAALMLMALDRAGSSVATRINTGLGSITDGIARAAHAPSEWGTDLFLFFQNRADQVATIQHLKEENLLIKGQMQQFFDLKQEVDHLKSLLHGQTTVVPNVLLARMTAINDTPEHRNFTINRGLNDGVKPGQPVIDGHGIVGQVLRSSLTGAVVIEIVSRRHNLSVSLGDTGFIGLLRGTGTRDTLTMDRIPDRYDVKVGDLLTTSGLDGVFPKGYPVARISQIHDDRGQAFLNIVATPVANLDHLSEVLVLTAPPDAPPPPSAATEQANTIDQPGKAIIDAGKPAVPSSEPIAKPPTTPPPAAAHAKTTPPKRDASHAR
ncbi:rod shape-determining protein MreC [Halothiobacillus diazotrophicus]|uniref:Cell shape-determining protein MreC n=1 Tax=Halothiobacillus diazotrophicus TaxID=1860122 RepID=A0A191ZGJ2_9GAMM|nr:rod shape-determining protein MreC [Halothiobacillus diazotrophicus]ANJ66975.1 rod shape-determining protein MreC [Halothiobacillus diazotrophicus]